MVALQRMFNGLLIPRASLLVYPLERSEVTVLACCRTCSCIPAAALGSCVLQHVDLALFSKICARPIIQRASGQNEGLIELKEERAFEQQRARCHKGSAGSRIADIRWLL